MTPEKQSTFGSFFGGFGSKQEDTGLNGPVTGSVGLPNYDLSILQKIKSEEDQYILPEGATHRRGRFEQAFAIIGTSCVVGGLLQGGLGTIHSLKTIDRSHPFKLIYNQTINVAAKQGAEGAKAFGVIALMYSAFGVTLSSVRGTDDAINTVTAGTATGMLFRSPGGLAGAARGGAIGFTLAAGWSLLYHYYLNPDKY